MFDGPAREFSNLIASVNRIASGLSRVRESAQQASRFAEQIEAAITRMSSPFDQLVLNDRLTTCLQYVNERHSQLQAGIQRHHEARLLVSAALPKRGWYLSGREPCTLSLSLANAVRTEDWEQVDQEVLKHLPKFKMEALREWLVQLRVPDYCVNRLCLFVAHHQVGCYEEATYIGVPLIDEIALHLYNGKSFTTKRANKRRGDQSRPELAIKTSGGPDLRDYCSAFVQTFGSLQEDSDQNKLTDEDYWNRHAIVHGMMRRAMGMKDSAKCLMAISFLFSARKETESCATAGAINDPNA